MGTPGPPPGDGRTRIVLLRHPPVVVPPGLCYGRSEVALRPGWRDAMPAIAAFAAASRPRSVLSSPSARCLLPAQVLADLLGLAPPRADPDLLELDFGEWDGLRWDRVPRDALDRWAADPSGFAPPGGETGAALLARVGRVAGRLSGRSALVVSHGGPLRLLPALLCGDPPDLLAPTPAQGVPVLVATP